MIYNILFTLFCFNIDNFENKGFDERYPKKLTIENSLDNDMELARINKYFEMQRVLNILENQEIVHLKKMNTLEEYSFLFDDNIAPNITNGGLFDDYYFRMF